MTPTLHPLGLVTPEFLPDPVRNAYGELIDATNRKATKILEDLSAELDRLTSDDRLTRKGVGERRAEAGARAHAALASALTNPLTKIEQDLNRARSELPQRLPVPTDPNASVFVQTNDALAVHEIRNDLRSTDPLHAVALVEDAARSRDHAILFAAQSISPMQRQRMGIDDAKWAEILKEFWSRENPKAFAKLDVVTTAKLTVRGNFATAQRGIGKASGADFEPTSQQALDAAILKGSRGAV